MYGCTAKHSDSIIMITLHESLIYAKGLHSCAKNINIVNKEFVEYAMMHSSWYNNSVK